MGRRRSSDSESESSYSRSRRKKKDKKRDRSRTRSRSSSSESSRYSSAKSKHKKSKKKHSSSRRSPSNSPSRYSSSSKSYRRERSRRSRSTDRLSRRSRSPDVSSSRHRSRSRSNSRSRYNSRRSRSRSNSRDYNKRRSRSDSRDRSKRKSGASSSSRRRSRSRSGSGSGGARHSSLERKKTVEKPISSLEKIELKRKALLAAADRDSESPSTNGRMSQAASDILSLGCMNKTSKEFADSLASIESDKFVPASFKSSIRVKLDPAEKIQSNHDDAIFGSLSTSGFTIKPDLDLKPVAMDAESVMHPRLFCDVEEKMEKWMDRLSQLRRRKLEGEAIQC